MGFIQRLITSPLLLSVIGWITVPFVFMIMTIAMMVGVSLELAFWILAPFWFVGLLSWVLGAMLGLYYMLMGPDRKGAFMGFAFSISPAGIAYAGTMYFSASSAFSF